MTKKKIVKLSLFVVGIGIIVAVSIALYLFNMPHRDVQATAADFTYTASEIVQEYLADSEKANEKYLDEEGESKILQVSGMVSSISEDFNHQKVVLLKNDNDPAGVSCTFTQETNDGVTNVSIGSQITVKGVIRSGATYDDDLGMYEHVIMEKCKIISYKESNH